VAGRGLASGQNYSAVSGIGGGELYAEQVFGTLRTGVSKMLFSGETVSLPVGAPASRMGNLYGR
jgi:hypothetical protein